MFDVLDTKHDTLFCSRQCALLAGAGEMCLRVVFSQEFEEAFTEDEGLHWGSLCPVCEKPYNNYT